MTTELQTATEKLNAELERGPEAASSSAIEDLQLEKVLLDDDFKELQSQHASLMNQLEATQKELQSISKATQEQTEAAHRQLQIQIEQLKSQVDETTQTIESHWVEIETFRAESQLLVSNVEEKDRELSSVRSLLEQSEFGLQTREEALESSRESHAKAMDDLRVLLEEDVRELRKENASLLEQLQHAKESAALEPQVPPDSAALEDLQLEKDLLEDDLAELRK